MTDTADTISAVWALELGGSAVRLVRIVRAATGVKLDRYHACELTDRFEAPPDAVEAIRSLGVGPIREPLVVVLRDEVTLYRMLDLPKADDDALQQMIAAQMEVLVPARSDRFEWSWDSEAHPTDPAQVRLWLCAARKDAIETAQRAAEVLGGQLLGIVPATVANLAAHRHLQPDQQAAAVVDIAARSTSVAVVDRGRLRGWAVLDQGPDHWIEQIAEVLELPAPRVEAMYRQAGAATTEGGQRFDELHARCLNEFGQQLREVYDAAISHLSRDERPQQCLLTGRSAPSPRLTDQVTRALSASVETITEPRPASSASASNVTGSVTAFGGALAALEPGWPDVQFAAAPKVEPTAPVRITRRRVGVLAWLIALLLGMYVMDIVEGRVLSNKQERFDATANERGDFEQQVKITQLLHDGGAPPLAVLDELTALSGDKMMLESWTYQRGGKVGITGTVANAAALDQMLQQLRKARTLDHIKPETQKPKEKKWAFVISADLGRWIVTPVKGKLLDVPEATTTDETPAEQPPEPAAEPEPAPETPPAAPPQEQEAVPAPQPETAPAPTPQLDEEQRRRLERRARRAARRAAGEAGRRGRFRRAPREDDQ